MGMNSEFAHSSRPDPYIVFDLETVPMPGCEPFIELEGIEAPSNWKDPEKIAAYVADKRRKLVESAGLDIDLCEIACLGWEDADCHGALMPRNVFEETDMLRKFWTAVGSTQLVGFNIWHFDLPVLVRRSLYLGVSVPADLRLDSYRPDGRVLDVAYVLSFGRKDHMRSLDFYCQRFGIAHANDVTGADVARLVSEGNWKAVTEHCYADLHSTHLLAERIGLIKRAVAA
jgi:predicted PolB exonuclease-like 3'-5' exonuclease